MNPQSPTTSFTPPPQKKNTASTIAVIVLVPCMIVLATAGLSFVTTRTQGARPCSGASAAKVREAGLELPEGATVCAVKTVDDAPASAGRTTSVRLLVAERSFLCATTFGKLGCSTLVRAEIGFLAAMPKAGWQDVTSASTSHDAPPGAEGKYSTLAFERGDGARATVMLSDDQGEISADVSVVEP